MSDASALGLTEEAVQVDITSRRSSKWADLRLRILSAIVMVPIALACIWVGGIAFIVLVALLTTGMAYEWLRLCRTPFGPRPVLMFAALPLSVLITALGFPALALALLGLITLVSCMRRTQGAPWILPLGVPYLGLAAVALIWLRVLSDDGRSDVIVLLLVIWATDIAAYAVGRAVGGPRLAPRISPGKTWSGTIGGVIAAMVVGVVAVRILAPDADGWQAALLAGLVAGLISCIGQAGDLFESALKRHFSVKDSGSLIPGHGGLLDRLDALLTAAPAAALLALVLGRGVIPWQ